MIGNNNSGDLYSMINLPANQSAWTRSDDKLFEHALVVYPEEMPDRWEKIAEHLPGKSPEDLRAHYDALVYDVEEIESGRVEVPTYSDDPSFGWEADSQITFKPRSKEGERKKGTPWTKEEHRLFLLGIETYGKGDWRSISRNVVVTRTATQVASHAQKYFLRQNSTRNQRKRSSIHDITTTVNTPPVLPPAPPQGVQMAYQNFNQPM